MSSDVLQHDSALTHAEIKNAQEQLRRDYQTLSASLEEHKKDDRTAFAEVSRKLDKLLTWRTQAMVLVTLAVLAAGGAALAFRWIVNHAVTDTLMQQGVLRFERTP